MTITWFFVGLLAGGMLGMLLMAFLAADDRDMLRARAEFCEEHHWQWNE